MLISSFEEPCSAFRSIGMRVGYLRYGSMTLPPEKTIRPSALNALYFFREEDWSWSVSSSKGSSLSWQACSSEAPTDPRLVSTWRRVAVRACGGLFSSLDRMMLSRWGTWDSMAEGAARIRCDIIWAHSSRSPWAPYSNVVSICRNSLRSLGRVTDGLRWVMRAMIVSASSRWTYCSSWRQQNSEFRQSSCALKGSSRGLAARDMRAHCRMLVSGSSTATSSTLNSTAFMFSRWWGTFTRTWYSWSNVRGDCKLWSDCMDDPCPSISPSVSSTSPSARDRWREAKAPLSTVDSRPLPSSSSSPSSSTSSTIVLWAWGSRGLPGPPSSMRDMSPELSSGRAVGAPMAFGPCPPSVPSAARACPKTAKSWGYTLEKYSSVSDFMMAQVVRTACFRMEGQSWYRYCVTWSLTNSQRAWPRMSNVPNVLRASSRREVLSSESSTGSSFWEGLLVGWVRLRA
mmetsp:Transcript_142796/g.249049  ORF Transcript_142796/g.249049 Transcript_142796/m.249049 type:complete len:457 (+) Transcript_142796:526-1896(+)